MSKIRKWRIEMLQRRLYQLERQYSIMVERLEYGVNDLKTITKDNRINYIMDICVLENIRKGSIKMMHITKSINKTSKLLEMIK